MKSAYVQAQAYLLRAADERLKALQPALKCKLTLSASDPGLQPLRSVVRWTHWDVRLRVRFDYESRRLYVTLRDESTVVAVSRAGRLTRPARIRGAHAKPL